MKRNFIFNGNRTPYGYKRSETDRHKLELDEECAKNVRRIFNLYLEGTTLNQIAYTFNDEHIPTPSQISGTGRNVCTIWKPSSIKHILKNEVYYIKLLLELLNNIQYSLDFLSYTTPILAVKSNKKYRILQLI